VRALSSLRKDSTLSRCFLIRVPLTKPRTVWGCQPVAFMISAKLAPLGRRISSSTSAFLLPSRASAFALGRVALFSFLEAVALALFPALGAPFLRLAAFLALTFFVATFAPCCDSPLSQGHAGHVHGGDRLPWGEHDNFAPLRSLDWQLHVYGNVGSDLSSAAQELSLATHTFPWGEQAHDAGFQRDAAYLVRPDGYVAAALSNQSASPLKTPIDRFGIRFASHS